MALTKPITHVLFDMDGLLLDTEIIYTRVTQQIVGRFGKVFDWSIKANIIGRRALDSSRYLVEAMDIPMTAEDYLKERDSLLREAFPDCEPLPGAERLVRHLHENKVPMAVATSSSEDLYFLKTQRHRSWFDLFPVTVTGDDPDIEQGKPAPDIFQVAAKRIGAAPESTLVFEDAPSGLAAAKAAGMKAIVVPDPNMDKSRYTEADVILNSLAEFDPVEFGLKPYSGTNDIA